MTTGPLYEELAQDPWIVLREILLRRDGLSTELQIDGFPIAHFDRVMRMLIDTYPHGLRTMWSGTEPDDWFEEKPVATCVSDLISGRAWCITVFTSVPQDEHQRLNYELWRDKSGAAIITVNLWADDIFPVSESEECRYHRFKSIIQVALNLCAVAEGKRVMLGEEAFTREPEFLRHTVWP